MKCKDIPDADVLAFLVKVSRGETHWTPAPAMQKGWGSESIAHVSATWYGDEKYMPENSVQHAMPPGVPAKLALAKIRQMVRRGVVSGCTCGCRGGFQITEKGLVELGIDGEKAA